VLGKASRWGYSWNKEPYDKAIKKLMPKKNERKRSGFHHEQVHYKM
jgi:hypothetical protein